MFEKYPDVVSVLEPCKILGDISKKMANGEIFSVRVGNSYNVAASY